VRIELDDGVWKLRGFPADNLTTSDLADAFSRAKAQAWIAESDDGTFGFGREGSCTVTLTLQPVANEPPRRLGLVFGGVAGANDEGVYARASDGPGVFVASSTLRALASRPPIDRGAVRLDLASADRVVLSRGGARIALSRGESGVFERAEADAGTPERLESALAGFRAEWALHAGPATADEGFDRPTLEINVVGSARDGAAPATARLAIGAPTRDGTTDGYFARAAGVDATFLVSRAAVHAILDAW
jgi:hypothetical protein